MRCLKIAAWVLLVAWGAAKLWGWEWGSVSGAVAPATPVPGRPWAQAGPDWDSLRELYLAEEW